MSDVLDPPVTVICMRDYAQPIITSFNQRNELIHYLRDLQSKSITPTQVFMFEGEQWKVSKPPLQHLISPNGTSYPLFDTDGPVEPDPNNFLYRPVDGCEVGPELKNEWGHGEEPNNDEVYYEDVPLGAELPPIEDDDDDYESDDD